MEPKIIMGVPPLFPERTLISIDTEWFKMQEGKLHRPTGFFACLTICPDGKTVYVITNKDHVSDAMDKVRPGFWVMANAKFDIRQLRRHAFISPRKRLFDVVLVEQLMYSGFYNDVGLKHLARRYFGMIMDKEARDYFSTAEEMNEEAIHYAALDAQVTWHIARKQKEIFPDTLEKIYYRIELPAMWAFLDFQGFPLDKEKWSGMAADRQKDADEIAESLGFNPGSPKQTIEALAKEGHRVKSTAEKVLSKVKGSKIAPQVIQYRKMKKLASTYGMSWIENDLEKDGRIYCDYWQIGAETGRPTSSNPCLTNVPIHEHPVYRECFIAPPGHVVLDADFSGQEVRILAQISQDKNLIKDLREGGNIYIKAGLKVFGREIKKGTKDYDDMKVIFLGTDYGMSIYGLAKRMEITEGEAERLQKKFFHTYPGVRRYMSKQKRAEDYVETYLGRRFWLNPYSYQFYRNALNSPIQGGAADQLKIAIGILHRRWSYEPFLLVTQVYDELVAIVPKDLEKEGARLMKEAMLESGELVHPSVLAVAEVKSGKNWLEAKGE